MLPKNVAEANDSEVDLGGSSGRGTEDGIDTEGDIDAEQESGDEESEEESDEESEASIGKSEEQRCIKWYFKQRDDGSGYRNKTFELDLCEPAGCGCELCDIVARLAIWFIRLVDPNAHLDDAVELEFIPISNLRFGWLNGIVDIRLYTESGLPILPLVDGSIVPKWSSCHNSPSSLDFIGTQLEECSTSHELCNESRHPGNPTRLLSIGSTPGHPIKLIESPKEKLKYAALSYCWGDAKFIRTLRSNLASHEKDIPPTDLPIVFLEAISLCHRFKVPFIWIDCLCIIQADKDDWEIESGRMGSYYSNAFFTISVTSSRNPDIPFLNVKKDKKYGLHLFPIRSLEGEGGDTKKKAIYAQLCPHWGSKQGGNLKTTYGYGPLTSRAWTWQESALSSRTIYFCHSQIWWECKTHFIPENRTEFAFWEETFGQSRALALAARDPFSAWVEVIAEYNLRSLTQETDRLPGISGAAERIQELMGGADYYAGIWGGEYLALGLCWYIPGGGLFGTPKDITTQRIPYIAPTWSWASVRGDIDILVRPERKRNFVSLIKVEKISTDVPYRELNPFGQVTGGRLEVTGRVIETELRYEGKDSFPVVKHGDGGKRDIYTDCVLACDGSSARRATSLDCDGPFVCKSDFLVVGYSRDNSQDPWYTFYVLVLGSAGIEGEDKTYCRLGIGDFNDVSLDSNWTTGGSEKTIVII